MYTQNNVSTGPSQVSQLLMYYHLMPVMQCLLSISLKLEHIL